MNVILFALFGDVSRKWLHTGYNNSSNNRDGATGAMRIEVYLSAILKSDTHACPTQVPLVSFRDGAE